MKTPEEIYSATLSEEEYEFGEQEAAILSKKPRLCYLVTGAGAAENEGSERIVEDGLLKSKPWTFMKALKTSRPFPSLEEDDWLFNHVSPAGCYWYVVLCKSMSPDIRPMACRIIEMANQEPPENTQACFEGLDEILHTNRSEFVIFEKIKALKLEFLHKYRERT